jgi:SAM-dependent methyltransferase
MNHGLDSANGTQTAYEARLATEERIYQNCESVHDLPSIFHYWSDRHIRPKLETFGFSSPNGMFRKFVEEQFSPGRSDIKRFASIGSGNCDLEVELALHLRTKGYNGFAIDCFDLNPAMIERGRVSAAKNAVAAQMRFHQVDLNEWDPAEQYDAVFANQTLHHILKLEDLFTRVKSRLKVGGAFIVSDMIGRNGHQRWPEALEIVQEFWRKLPPSYRFNRAVQRYEERYEDWDCSGESFEGIRSQDILPLLLEHFQFRLFVGFANVIDPFVDRAFGYNFDAKAAWDRRFIDQVHERDEKEIVSGRVTPTHMLAVLGSGQRGSMMFHEPLTPEYCLRRPAVVAAPAQTFEGDAYEWQTWPHSPQTELEIACRRLTSVEAIAKHQTLRLNAEIRELAARALELERQLEERTSWALQLNHELAETTEWTQRLDQQLQERTQWALVLDQELEQRTESTLRLNQELDHRNREFEERTVWALSLNEQLGERNAQINQLTQLLEQVAWARALDRHFHGFFDSAYRLVRWIRHRATHVAP